MLKDNILLTAHTNIQTIPTEILKEMEKKIDKFEEICFETDLLEVMVSHPQQIMILDYYLAFLALKKNKKVTYFTPLIEEAKELEKFNKEFEKLNLTIQERHRIEKKGQEMYVDILKDLYLNNIDNMKEHNKKYNAITNKKHTQLLTKTYKRDSKWDLTDNKKL